MTRSALRVLAAVTVVASASVSLVGCMQLPTPETDVVLTMRIWDDGFVPAYRASLDEFTTRSGIEVELEVTPWESYGDELRGQVASETAPDVFWLNNTWTGTYADAGALVEIGATLHRGASSEWDPTVTSQFERDGGLWAVPQFTDAGVAVFYNAELLAAAGVSPDALDTLTWSHEPEKDTYLATARALTLDATGVAATDPAFQPDNVQVWGTSLGYDLQAVLLPFLGSAGAQFQDGEQLAFAEGKGIAALDYVVGAIHDAKVAPPAEETTADPQRARELFLEGRIAMFQSGIYSLREIADRADFEWGIAMLPAGPAGRVSVTNGIGVAGNAHSASPHSVVQLLEWLGSPEGNIPLGVDGQSVPAVLDAQPAFFEFWKSEGVDVSPFFTVLEGKTIAAPCGARFWRAQDAYDPLLQAVFAGARPVHEGVILAQDAANAALK